MKERKSSMEMNGVVKRSEKGTGGGFQVSSNEG